MQDAKKVGAWTFGGVVTTTTAVVTLLTQLGFVRVQDLEPLREEISELKAEARVATAQAELLRLILADQGGEP